MSSGDWPAGSTRAAGAQHPEGCVRSREHQREIGQRQACHAQGRASSELSAARPEQRRSELEGRAVQRTTGIRGGSSGPRARCRGDAQSFKGSPDIPRGGCDVSDPDRALIDAVPSSCALADDAASAVGGRMLASRSPPPVAGATLTLRHTYFTNDATLTLPKQRTHITSACALGAGTGRIGGGWLRPRTPQAGANGCPPAQESKAEVRGVTPLAGAPHTCFGCGAPTRRHGAARDTSCAERVIPVLTYVLTY